MDGLGADGSCGSVTYERQANSGGDAGVGVDCTGFVNSPYTGQLVRVAL